MIAPRRRRQNPIRIEALETRIAPAFAAVIELADLNGSDGFKLPGVQDGDGAGRSVSDAGDVNGDSIGDFIIGANGADSGGNNRGAAYVVFGTTGGFPASFALSGLDGTNGFKILGVANIDLAGASVSAAGDVNNDGFDDIIIGAENAPSGGSFRGAAYVVFGKSSGFGATFALSGLDGNNGFKLSGVADSDAAGISVAAAGDVNGDGFDDVIVGATGADEGDYDTGAVYVFFGKAGGFAADIALASLDGNNGFKLTGVDEGGDTGHSVSAAGDINNDNFDDIIIGARFALDGASVSGAAYVIFGQASGFAAGLALAGLNGTNGFKLLGAADGDYTGNSVSGAGDVNGDGFDDLIVGAFNANEGGLERGASYVVFGKTGGFAASVALAGLDGNNGFKLSGVADIHHAGYSVSGAGDVDGDGFDDIIVGAPFNGENGFRSGAAYVVFGKAAGFGASVALSGLDGTNGFKLLGIAGNDYTGDSVSGAGDVNGDGFDDIIVGAYHAYAGGAHLGVAYVVFGIGDSPTEVTTSLDVVNAADGVVSLREAIIFANSNPGLDTITFNIPGAGVKTIAVTSSLPTITEEVIINGYSQPGAKANTLATGSDAILRIELTGTSASNATGLRITSGGSTVRGLVLNGFGGDAIVLSGGGGNTIIGNYFGTNADGDSASATNFRGVFVSGSSSNIIGSAEPGDRNIFTNQQHVSVDIAFGASNNIVQGNYFGTNAAGTAPITNFLTTILVNGSAANHIGGTAPGAGNLFANTAQGNFQAIVFAGSFMSAGNTAEGNIIGTDVTLTLPLGFFTAVATTQNAHDNMIGGSDAGAGNYIANSTGKPVDINQGAGNTVRRNTFVNCAPLLIDLDADGPTPNDAGDGDGGANNRQNFPVLTTATNIDGEDLRIVGTLDTLPGTYTIELFRSASSTGNAIPLDAFIVTVGAVPLAFDQVLTGRAVGNGVFVTATVTNNSTGDTSEFSLDIVAGDGGTPEVVSPKDPLTFTDASGDIVKVTISGKGTVNVLLQGGAQDNADIAFVELIGTDLTTNLSIAIISKNPAGTTVTRISTTDPLQHVGGIKLGTGVTLGDGTDALPDLRVTGKMSSLTLDDIAANTLIQLGEGLPYDLPGTKDPDSLNNRPTLTIGDVLGAGVEINVLNNGIPGPQGGVGGGGFGNVVIHSWAFNGFIRTTQSIGNFTVKTGDFFGVLEVDKLHHGEGTRADVGAMTIADGAWGSSGTEIEGYVTSFNAEAFLAHASITAGNIGSIVMASSTGGFEGTLILTDPDAPTLPTFTVNSNFSGRVVSANSIKKLNIKGDFTGSLEAPSIGAITAFRFLGTAGDTDIVATVGGIGLLKSTSGVFRDYDIVTPLAFSGISVKLTKLTEDTIGVNNVHITAASVGNIDVSLSAAKGSTGVDLIGINDSEFITTSIGTTAKTSGRIGNITVTLAGGANGNATGITDAMFDAILPSSTVNALGNITVKIAGFGGNGIGVSDSRFEGNSIGAVKVSVTRGKAVAATGFDIRDVVFTATHTIGAMTFDGDATATQVSELTAVAGGSIGKVTIKSKTTGLGSLEDSTLLAGQALNLSGADKQLKVALGGAGIGAVTASGNITGSIIAAGASVQGVTVGGEMRDSLVLAGAMLGADRAIGGGDDTFQRAASIAAITVKGAFARTSIAAGINPGNAVFGDGDDTLAAAPGNLTATSSIGAIKLSLQAGPQPATGLHNYSIEAASIKSLKTIAGIVNDFGSPVFLDSGTLGEDTGDVIVRVL